MSQICDRDCFNCRFDDCICDEMTADDWKAARGIDDFIHTKTEKEKSIAAKQKQYYEENRESIAAKQKKYREENRESIAAYQKQYYEENRESIAAYQKRYREENRETLISFGDALRAVRKRLKLSQADAGRLVGLSQRQMSYYERGEVPFDLSIIEKLKGYKTRLGL